MLKKAPALAEEAHGDWKREESAYKKQRTSKAKEEIWGDGRSNSRIEVYEKLRQLYIYICINIVSTDGTEWSDKVLDFDC